MADRIERIVSFRPEGGAADALRERPREWKVKLREADIELVEIPLLSARKAPESRSLESMLDALNEDDWILFTSANAVWFAKEELARRFAKGRIRTACVGEHTAEVLSSMSPADFIPSTADAESFAREFVAALSADKLPRLLFVRGRKVNPALPEFLRGSGFKIQECIVYETVPRNPTPAEQAVVVEAAGSSGSVFVFTNSESVRELKRRLLEWGVSDRDAHAVRCFAIGPATALTLSQSGFCVAGVAPNASMDSVVELLVEHRNNAR